MRFYPTDPFMSKLAGYQGYEVGPEKGLSEDFYQVSYHSSLE